MNQLVAADQTPRSPALIQHAIAQLSDDAAAGTRRSPPPWGPPAAELSTIGPPTANRRRFTCRPGRVPNLADAMTCYTADNLAPGPVPSPPR